MKIDRISYQKVFPLGVYTNHRIGMEASLDEGEDVAQALQQLKKTVEDFHNESTSRSVEGMTFDGPYINGEPQPHLAGNGSEQGLPEPTIEQQAVNMVTEMRNCTTLEALKPFRMAAFSPSMGKFPEVQTMYETRLRSLTKTSINS